MLRTLSPERQRAASNPSRLAASRESDRTGAPPRFANAGAFAAVAGASSACLRSVCREPSARSRSFVVLWAAGLLWACGAREERFPLRAPMWVDTDLRSVSVPCRPGAKTSDPSQLSCAPREYVSSLVWDGADNLLFRPLSDLFAVKPEREAWNVNSMDEVPNSAWFTNRLGVRPMSLDELELGACEPGQLLDPDSAADGSWVIDKGKPNGASLGFRVRIPGKGLYMFKSDAPSFERPSAAGVIGAAAYHAVGFNTSCEQIVYFKPSLLKLTPGLRYTPNFGPEREFDEKELARVLELTPRRGGLVRFQASAWLPGETLGPFRYQGTREDDPNDVVPHELRRELRGGRLLAAWLNHFDAREQNTMDVWLADDPARPRSSPGHVIHYYLDTSDSLGSEWDWDLVSRRLGHAYVIDWADIGRDFVTLGIPRRAWDKVKRAPGHEIFGYFDVANFVPEDWKMEYPNRAFSDMTERDGAWMTRILARFTPEMVDRLARMGQFSKPGDTEYIASVLKGRLQRILKRYLDRLSPITDLRVEARRRLCGVDLSALRALNPPYQYRYVATSTRGELLLGHRLGGARVCFELHHFAADGGARDDSPTRYVKLALDNGVAQGPLVAHLYDLGPRRGFFLAGIERPSSHPSNWPRGRSGSADARTSQASNSRISHSM